jgi:cysteinyl-tRNA synthetase
VSGAVEGEWDVSLRIYNTQTRNKEIFVPLKEGEVKMYVCGPTVYDFLHVGNFRGPIFFNLVRNWLEICGYRVTFAYNYTDVDDKIIDRANKEGVPSAEIAERYIGEFEKDFAALKLRPHSLNPKVTLTMGQIVELVSDLIKCGKAYVTADGEVLYSVRSFSGYGKLSNKNLDDLEAGARVEVDKKKRDPMDFALWKPAKSGEPKWPSPWSEGRPGWHIECSAMIRSIFGDSIDIHGGGADLIFPHHENEIAQSEGVTGKPFVKYWMHNNMLTFGDRKMSKSLGNIKKTREFVQEYNAEILKYMMLSVHYRSLSDFSEQAVHFAVAALARIYSALNVAVRIIDGGQASGQMLVAAHEPSKALAAALAEAERTITEALNDDFNTPEMFAGIFSMIRVFNAQVRLGAKVTPETLRNAQVFHEWVLKKGGLLALFQENSAEYLRVLDDMLLKQKGLERAKIDELVAARTQVRAAKDFKRSDELRDELMAMGISLQDSSQGTSWEVTK